MFKAPLPLRDRCIMETYEGLTSRPVNIKMPLQSGNPTTALQYEDPKFGSSVTSTGTRGLYATEPLRQKNRFGRSRGRGRYRGRCEGEVGGRFRGRVGRFIPPGEGGISTV